MPERIFIVNKEGEASIDKNLPILNRYENLLMTEGGNYFKLLIEKEKKMLKNSSIDNFLSGITKEQLDYLIRNKPEDKILKIFTENK